MTKKSLLKRQFRSLRKRERFLKRMEKQRRVRIYGLRLHQRLQMDLHKWYRQMKMQHLENRKKASAKKETAKLNRTLKRRRKR